MKNCQIEIINIINLYVRCQMMCSKFGCRSSGHSGRARITYQGVLIFARLGWSD